MLHHTDTELLELATDATLLAVWAHPDDESFLAGGLISSANDLGSRVVNVTATLGELGTDDPDTWTPERLGRRRRSELDNALTVLGGAEVETLGVIDGSCAAIDDRLGARRVNALVAHHRPDVIVTFGPDGVTGHPDHQAVGRWTDLAARHFDPTIPVLHAVPASAWPADLIDPMHDVGAFFPGYPDRRHLDADRSLRLSGAALDRKLAALDCHASQMGPLRTRLGADGYRRLFEIETYRPANEAAALALGGRRRTLQAAS